MRSEKAGTSGTMTRLRCPGTEHPEEGLELPSAEPGRLARLAGPIQAYFRGDIAPREGTYLVRRSCICPETNLVSGKSNTLPTNLNSTSDPALRIGWIGLA